MYEQSTGKVLEVQDNGGPLYIGNPSLRYSLLCGLTEALLLDCPAWRSVD